MQQARLSLLRSLTSKKRVHSHPARYFRGPHESASSPLSARFSSTATAVATNNVRGQLSSSLKAAMKSKDTFASTVLRSVLSEINLADKSPTGKVADSQVVSIIRKAITRRTDSASQFIAASRTELAEAESKEANYLSTFLPPTMPEEEVDALLQKIWIEQKATLDSKRAMGVVLKSFYSQVDRSLVDGQLVKRRAELLLSKGA